MGNVIDAPTIQITCGVQLHPLALHATEIGQTCWSRTGLESRPLPASGREAATSSGAARMVRS
ncbi:hypothetical protein ACFVWY_31775 [Streptomyces sp. NPDC058195]|uniref:hypothetical protein n=1 Tax=Streptomyces sp. NPDC058195 TaxID=3346375 RepID=UPI0036E7E942